MISIIHRYAVYSVISSLFVSFIMFSFFLITMDLIQDLIKYLFLNIPVTTIVKVQSLYIPTSMSYALPIAILFAVTFSLAQLNANNELITLYSSGISLFRFVIPLLIIGGGLSFVLFFFQEQVVIDTFRQKNELKRTLLNQKIEKSNNQVSLLQDGGKVVYYAEFYNDIEKRLSDIILVRTTDENFFRERVDAKYADWNGEYWVFYDVKVYSYDPIYKEVYLENMESYIDETLNIEPRFFQKVISNVDEMRYFDALNYIEELKARGLSYRKLLTDTYSRLPLAFSPLIVMIMACISGNIFKKNALLLSLLTAVTISIVYYFSDLLGNILAAKGFLAPIIGAWFGFVFTLLISWLSYKFFIR